MDVGIGDAAFRIETPPRGAVVVAAPQPAFLDTEPMQRILDIMKGRAFHNAVMQLPGYVAQSPGTVSTVKEFLDIVDTGAVTDTAAPAGKRKRPKPG